MGNERPRVVIVGAGFGGLWSARALAGAPVEVLLLDRNNYHTLLPLLYQVAAAELEPEAIAYPVRRCPAQAAQRRIYDGRGTFHTFPARTLIPVKGQPMTIRR